jgi:ABC-type polysaccharide/polyol phosphate transport system ATPase subunit
VTPGDSTPPADRPGRPALVVDGVSKRFEIPHERRDTLKERALHPFSRTSSARLEALRNVSFTVDSGEFFGVVGRNGSGKSTLLKCMAGIYRVDEGGIFVGGRLSTFIELGVGFNPDMAARDNVILNGIMLGLTPREARERFDRVIEFAELQEFVEMKLKNYSSGMHVRLAFSVMIQVDADVLLIDEILAVGDAGFQQKCFDVFFRLRDEGKTIVFVTHDMAAVERFCHRALLLERGEVVTLGHPKAVADRYLEMNFARGQPGGGEDPGAARAGDGAARVVEAWMEDEHGVRQSTFPQGRACAFKALVRFEEAIEDPSFAVAFVNGQQQNVFVASSASGSERSGRFEPGESATFSVSFENALAPGRYALSTVIARAGSGGSIVDRFERIFSVVVTGSSPGGGLVDLPHDVSLERSAVQAAAQETR